MKKHLIGFLAVLFVSITGTITIQAIEFHLKDKILEQPSRSITPHVEPGNFPYVVHPDYLIPTPQKQPIFNGLKKTIKVEVPEIIVK